METNNPPEMLTPDQFVGRLKQNGIYRSAEAIRQWCRKGLPGAVMIGGTWEIKETTVEYVVSGQWNVRKVRPME